MDDLRRVFAGAAAGMLKGSTVEQKALRVLVIDAVECAEFVDEVLLEDVVALIRWAKHHGAEARDLCAHCGIVRDDHEPLIV